MRNTDNDRIEVGSDVIATIVAGAIKRVPGVYGMHGSIVNDVMDMLGKHQYGKGVLVEPLDNGAVNIDVHIVVEFLSSIPSIAKSVQKEIKEYVEKLSSVKVNEVRVFIDDVVKL